MNLAAIEMPVKAAREAFLDYRDAVRDKRHGDPHPEDEALMRAYRVLMRGERVIRLSEVLFAGGTTLLEVPRRYGLAVDVELPRLAVARADKKFTWCGGISPGGDLEMVTKRERGPNNQQDVCWCPGLFEPAERQMVDNTATRYWAPSACPATIVPIVPPKLRPKRSQLANFDILFEAEWAVHTPPAPVDPALLRHLGADLYAVVAVWDLTPLERAVLALREAV